MLDPHEMHLVTTYPTGAEMWLCPACGQTILTHWPPSQSRIVLVPGDQDAIHEERSVAPYEDLPDTTPHDEAFQVDELRPWLKWLRDAGLAG